MITSPGAIAGDFLVLPGNTDIVEVFMALQTQWRSAPRGGLTGIDYATVIPTLDLLGIEQERRRSVFDGLRVMEYAALEALRDG